jgi:PTH1 family peptidyl-tRNA hydrolase
MPRRNSPEDLPAAPDFLVLGLGNPGKEYRESRHNLGFRVADALATAHRGRWTRAPGPSLTAAVALADRRGVLAKPLTWMNRSGVAARALVERLAGPSAERILVVVDDLDLPLGRLRLRAGGGHGGHNGLRSVIAELGTNEFPRLRLGIGRPPGDESDDVVDHVLEPFVAEERDQAAQLVARARECVEAFVAEGTGAAMQRFNA